MHFRAAACAALVLASCSRAAPPGPEDERTPLAPKLALASASEARVAPETEARLPAEERTWSYATTGVGRMSVVVLVPERRAGEKFPVLITMHGLGEALKGPARGARGWIDDYGLRKAIERVREPPLTGEDFQGFFDAARLARLNAGLERDPFRGLVVVCPYTPDALRGDEPFVKAPPLARFLVDELLPRVYRETPALGTPESTGIDGVSLGGRAAVTVGLLRPQAFAAVAGLQAAFDVRDAAEIAERARLAKQKNPGLALRFLTSEGDYFLRANQAIGRALEREGVPRELLVVPGPHDYEFNRGPGALEMLVYHDRVLRGLAPL